MNQTQSCQGKANRRLVTRVALAALCLGSVYGCAVSNAEGEAAGDVALDGAGDVTPAGIGTIGPTPTATVTVTSPLPQLIYHDVIDLRPGLNQFQTVGNDAQLSPFRVKVADTLGLNGAVSASVAGPTNPSPASCAQYEVEFTVEGFRDSTNAWEPVATRQKTGSYSAGSGEFPTPSCGLSASVSINASPYSDLRVYAKGWQHVVFNGQPIDIKRNTSVSAYGTNPVPDPGKLLRVTDVALNASKTGVITKVKNDGPLTATSVRATVSGHYEYCPVAQPGESKYCDSNGKPCDGNFCPQSVNPSGNEFWPHRQPKSCDFSASTNTDSTLVAGQTITYTVGNVFHSSDPGCQPCTNDGRCADIFVQVLTDSLDENDPWDTWDEASSSEAFPGVVH